MKTLRSQATRDVRESRRYRGYELHQLGWTQTAIAQALGVTQGTVSQWLKQASREGIEALRAQPIPGSLLRSSHRRLKKAALAELPALLEPGAEAYGFRGSVWTRQRIAVVIEQIFGVRYTPRRVGGLLKEIGWSYQRPQTKARQQDAQAIEIFWKETWPEVKRGL